MSKIYRKIMFAGKYCFPSGELTFTRRNHRWRSVSLPSFPFISLSLSLSRHFLIHHCFVSCPKSMSASLSFFHFLLLFQNSISHLSPLCLSIPSPLLSHSFFLSPSVCVSVCLSLSRELEAPKDIEVSAEHKAQMVSLGPRDLQDAQLRQDLPDL